MTSTRTAVGYTRSTRRWIATFGVLACAHAACSRHAPAATRTSDDGPSNQAKTLMDLRRGFATKLEDPLPRGTPAPRPPPTLLELVRYPSPVGSLSAYVSPPPADGVRRPAIIWLIGGFDNGIDDTMWSPAPTTNDQSARAFREAGVVLFTPSLRGGNDNPGRREVLLGEVDDVVAAVDFVAGLSYVDPARIYLGGHSTGGTLALLVAEATPRFRAVFAFGPVADAGGYSGEVSGLRDVEEARMRSPLQFVSTIRTPTFIIEGTLSANAPVLALFSRAADHAPVRTFAVAGATHFSALAPVSALLARKILDDKGPSTSITMTEGELTGAAGR